MNGDVAYDMLGNAFEWSHDVYRNVSPDYPAVDPFGEIGDTHNSRVTMGGSAYSHPSLLRAAMGYGVPANAITDGGIRLVRTLVD
jgi:formylglycine-generating enzyme required for sulfatase activity